MKGKVSELRSSDKEKLLERVTEFKAELSKERAAIASGTRAEKPAKIKNLRREIARMLTVLNEKKDNENRGVKK